MSSCFLIFMISDNPPKSINDDFAGVHETGGGLLLDPSQHPVRHLLRHVRADERGGHRR